MAQNEAQKLNEVLGVTHKITLSDPIDTPNGVVSELILRKVKVKDYKKAAERNPNNPALQQLAVLALASGLQEEDFDELSWEDYQHISQFCLGTN